MTTLQYTSVSGIGLSTPGNVLPGYLGTVTAPEPRTPEYEFMILPPNSETWLDLTKYLEQTQWQITQQFTRQGDTATFYLYDADVFYTPVPEPERVALDYTALSGTGISTPGNVLAGFFGTSQPVGGSVSGATSSLHFVIPPLSQVIFRDTSINEVLFAGLVQKPKMQWQAPTLMQWELDCVDWSIFLTYATVQPVSFPLTDTNGNVIETLSTALLYLLNGQQPFEAGTTTYTVTNPVYGVSGALAPAGYVQDTGVTLTGIELTYQTLTDALNLITQWASINDSWGYRVDANRQLHFAPVENFSQNVVLITDEVSLSQSPYNTAHIVNDKQLRYNWDATQLRNTVTGIGGNTEIMMTDTWLGDGLTTQWILSSDYDPALEKQATLLINSVITAVTVIGSKQPKVTPPWSLAQSNERMWVLRAATAPAAGVPIVFSYYFRQPMIYPATVQSNPYTLLPNHGVFAEIISDTSLKTLDSLAARVQRELVEYGQAVEEITLTTGEDFLGHILAGDTITISLSFVPDSQRAFLPGISDVFLVTQNTISASQHGGGYRTYQLTATRLQFQNGISRAQTIQDILYQLNLDSRASVNSTLALIGNFIADEETVSVADSVTLASASMVTIWNAGLWGQVVAQ